MAYIVESWISMVLLFKNTPETQKINCDKKDQVPEVREKSISKLFICLVQAVWQGQEYGTLICCIQIIVFVVNYLLLIITSVRDVVVLKF